MLRFGPLIENGDTDKNFIVGANNIELKSNFKMRPTPPLFPILYGN